MQTFLNLENHNLEVKNTTCGVVPYKSQLLKWIGNKQRFAHEIISFFPKNFNVYHEPFLGSAAVLGVLAPRKAEASDCFEPLIKIWQYLQENPEIVIDWYRERWERMKAGNKKAVYEEIKASYNKDANPADMLFLCRTCYGGVVRFRQKDGYMSTPCGVHNPIHPTSFARRAFEWYERTKYTSFSSIGYEEALERAGTDDVVYCDPPYSYSQAILYGAQDFSLDELLRSIEKAKRRGAFVALSIDGSKKSGDQDCAFDWPTGLFARETAVNVGRSMLRRFQMRGETLETELVKDRLLLTH